MKFLTEIDLRQKYKNNPFEIYEEEEGTRLTPGARQYLLDRGVKFKNTQKKVSILDKFKEENTISTKDEIPVLEDLNYKVIETIKAQILVLASELLDSNTYLAEELFTLINDIENFIASNNYSDISCITTPCNIESEKENTKSNKCFLFNSSYIRGKNGKEIAKLYYLICTLEEKLQKDNELQNNVINCIIGKLTQITCQLLRSNVCQKKI